MPPHPSSPSVPGLETSRLLASAGFAHAFFTRHGGVSTGAWASLSFSVAAGDAPDHVAENLRRAASTLGVEPGRLHYLSQVHGAAVVTLGAADDREDTLQREGDALVATSAGVACGVRYADCAPVLLADGRSGAVAAVHAGWRGTEAGVVAAAVRALRERVGPGAELIAAVGPHISARAFEVGEDVAARLAALAPGQPVVVRGPDASSRPHVDLRAILHHQLRTLGLAEGHIEHVGGCTWSDPERYFSFRRDGARSGRHLAAVVARGGSP